MPNVIALLTDYGTDDGSAACLEAVIKNINPVADVIHISHNVPGWDISAASMFLEVYYKYYPPGTVFVAVVDPGVGSERWPLAILAEGFCFVGPDNGIFTRVIEKTELECIVKLDKEEFWLKNISSTFHGRDIFAPVGAHLSRGSRIEEVGCEVSLGEIVDLEPFARQVDSCLITKVIFIDRWGNMVIGVKKIQFIHFLKEANSFRIDINSKAINDFYVTFSDIPQGKIGLLFGGDFGEYGTIAMNMGNAAETCGAEIGAQVIIRKK